MKTQDVSQYEKLAREKDELLTTHKYDPNDKLIYKDTINCYKNYHHDQGARADIACLLIFIIFISGLFTPNSEVSLRSTLTLLTGIFLPENEF